MKSKTLTALLDYDYIAIGRVIRVMKISDYIDALKFLVAHFSVGLVIWLALKKGILEVPQGFMPSAEYINKGRHATNIHIFNAISTATNKQRLNTFKGLVRDVLLIQPTKMRKTDFPSHHDDEDLALIGYVYETLLENKPNTLLHLTNKLLYSIKLDDVTTIYLDKAGINIEFPHKSRRFHHFTTGKNTGKLVTRMFNNKLINHVCPGYDFYVKGLDNLVDCLAASDEFIYEIFYDELTQPAISPYVLSGATFKQLTSRLIAEAVEGLLTCSTFNLVRGLEAVKAVLYGGVDVYDDFHTYYRTGIQLQEMSLAKHLMTLPNHNPIKSTLATTLFKYGVLSIPFPEALRASNVFETEVAAVGAYYLNVFSDMDGLTKGLRDFLRSCSAHEFCVACIHAGALIMPDELLYEPNSRDLMAIGQELKNQKMTKTLDLFKC